MKLWIVAFTTTAALVSLVVPVSAQQPRTSADCKASAPAKVEGQVTSVDPASGMVTLRAADGTTHQFQASREVLQTMKAGDRLEATLRQPPKC